jgi:hypothetical protein
MMAIRPNGRHSAAGIVILLLAMASWTCVLGAYELDMVFQTKCIFEEVEEEGMEVTGNYQAFLKTDRSSSVAVNIKVRRSLCSFVFCQRRLSTLSQVPKFWT